MPITPLPDADFSPTINPANYSQSMGTYNSPKTFKFWCQKVLPLVYDDSLSYYELLCKVVDYLNKTMEDVNTAVGDVNDLNNSFNSLQSYTNTTFHTFLEVYNELQNYVNTYFDGLDVQQEVNIKLDEMAEDGTLDRLLAPYMEHYQTELDVMKGRLTVLETQYTPGGTSADAELADIRVGFDGQAWSTAGDAVRGQVTNLNSAFIKSNEGIMSFYGYGNFQNYGLEPDGTFDIGVRFRVSNDNPMTFTRNLLVKVKNGFRWGYIPFTGSTAGSWSGWKTADTVMPAGTSFVIEIARISENRSEIANVNEFVNAVTFNNTVYDELKSLSNDYTKTKSEFTNSIDELEDVIVITSSTGNILDVSKSKNGYLDSFGNLIVNSDWKTTPFIRVEGFEKVWFSAKVNGSRDRIPMYFLCTYGTNKSFIEQKTGNANNYEVESNVKYIQFSYHDSALSDLMVRYDGDFYTTYVAYKRTERFDESQYQTKSQVNSSIDTTMGSIAVRDYTEFSTIIQSNKLLLTNGNITDYEGYSITDYIDVSEYEKIYITGSSNYQNAIANFYNSNHEFISCAVAAGAGATETIYTLKEVIVPIAAKYVVVGGKSTTPSSSYISGYSLKKNVWETKKWLCFGDSLTDSRNTRATKRYFDYVHDNTGIQIINGGVSGSGYAKDGEATFGEDTNWHERILTYNNTDFDVITFFGSFNDLSSGVPLGTATDSETTTIGGCINVTLDNLFSFKPLAIVGIITPTPWQYANPTDTSANNYVNLLIDICKLRSIPCLDLFHESLLRPWDATFRQLAYSHDDGGGTHPDETGHAIIAPRFEGFLDTLILH